MPVKIPFANIHTHHFIGDYIPDAMFLQQTKLNESTARLLEKSMLLRLLFAIIYPRLNDFLKMLTSSDVGVVRDYHLKEMDACGIDYSVVLLMDYSLSAPIVSKMETLADYRVILRDTAESCACSPFRFFLFHYFDPRYMVMADTALGKQDFVIGGRLYHDTTFAVRLMLQAFFQYGCVGVKMYPPLGFHPVPEENLDPENLIQVQEHSLNRAEREMVKLNLEFLYAFAQEHGLPLMTHCGPGGSYNVVVSDTLKGRHVWRFTNPLNFERVVKNYPDCRFRICFAHMGGKTHKIEEYDMARIWREKILYLIKTYPGVFYTDQSFDLSNFLKMKKKNWNVPMLEACVADTQRLLDDTALGRFILFGSDWPLGYHQYMESDYTEVYRSGLSDSGAKKYFGGNQGNFLFGADRVIPAAHIAFLKERHHDAVSVPDWVQVVTEKGDTVFRLA